MNNKNRHFRYRLGIDVGVIYDKLPYYGEILVGHTVEPMWVSDYRRTTAANAPFASRGDSSGTHQKELELWRDSGLDIGKAAAGWYRRPVK